MRRMLPLLAALAVVLGFGSPAAAHGQLAFSEPAHQTTVKTPLERLALYFTEKPASNAYFTLTAPTGQRVDKGWSHGEPRRLDKPVEELILRDGKWEPMVYNAGFPAMLTASHWPVKGVYTIRYISLASDGDKVTGEIRFDYQGPISKAPDGWQPPTNEPDPALVGGQTVNATATGGTTATATPVVALPAEEQGTSPWIYVLVGLVALVGGFFLLRRVRRT
ncbi:methionine-rich copper-binding protein CopC [Allocatelliglobosispora scoriae]|uniref:Methionine-rich copper-binding protein CopC n=1 Tax=Allocatelliglobosispora scoriae TaxID=643052 RepID=A0A841C0N9_9ACTN|nr:copper resistance protein CopC [Allocatelliglobosispora scoriae]MBB5872622.1 methionine-rich copper-binding protein CopC [Allocatelliglobosispora scoriae]